MFKWVRNAGEYYLYGNHEGERVNFLTATRYAEIWPTLHGTWNAMVFTPQGALCFKGSNLEELKALVETTIALGGEITDSLMDAVCVTLEISDGN